MEVQHHPHPGKKSFKEYILEFFMIFLAVTMGFFAENLREYFKDQAEIQNDVQSMVSDLRSDTAMYNFYISSNQLSDRRIDTLISMLKKDRSNTAEIYFLARYITANNNTFTPTTKTFELMKSSDALKLVRSRNLLDSISEYYQLLQYFPGVNNLQNEKLSAVHLANGQLFDGYTFQKMFDVVPTELSVVGNIKKPQENVPLLSDNRVAINAVIIAYHYLYAVTEVNNKGALVRCQMASRLINLLKREYGMP
ncbi:MAG TPA: hypothetical protein VKR32_16035 [Puia sp.]|nr:hypothetical protein [Puia sp.]